MKGRDSRGVTSVPGGKLRWGCYTVGLKWRKSEGGMGGGAGKRSKKQQIGQDAGEVIPRRRCVVEPEPPHVCALKGVH